MHGVFIPVINVLKKIPAKFFFIIPMLFSIVFGILVLSPGANLASGFDGYYYAIQTKQVTETGTLALGDNPLIFYITGAAAFCTGDSVRGIFLIKILIMGASAALLYLLVHKITGRILPALFAAIFWSASFSGIYFGFEFLKNNAGNLLIISFLLVNTAAVKLLFRSLFCQLMLLIAFFTHDLSAALILLASIYLLGREIIPLLAAYKHRILIFSGAAAIAAVLCTVFIILRHNEIFQLIKEISITEILERYGIILYSFHPPVIRWELFLLVVLPLPVAVALFFFFRRFSPVVRCIVLLLFVLSLPIVKFEWHSASYRFLLQTQLFLSIVLGMFYTLWLPQKGAPAPRHILINAAPFTILLVLFIFLPQKLQHIKHDYQPDYGKLVALVQIVTDRIPDSKKIIAHHGLASMLWYYTGIQTEHFVPETNFSDYFRIAYGFGPIHFEPYLTPEDSAPVFLTTYYTLLPETVWQRFYADRKADISFLHSWLNPYLKRPAHVSRVIENQKQ